MDLLQLQYFRTIAQYENLTKAAQALFVSQPNLSTSLSRLEDDLGVTLFERRRGKIALTRNGKLFLTYVERVLDELDNGISQVRAAEHAEHDQIRVVSSQLDFISEILRENYPKDEKIKIKQVRCANLDVFDRVLSDDADFGFYHGEPKSKMLEYTPIISSERIAIVHKEHPLAGAGHISVSQLEGEPMICNYCRDDAELFGLIYGSFGVQPHVFFECDDTQMEATLVSSGRGISISPFPNYYKFMREDPGASITFLYFDEPLPPAHLGIVRRYGIHLTDSALHFLQCATEFFKRDHIQALQFMREHERDRPDQK